MDSRTVRCRGILEGEECGAPLQRNYKFCNECGNLIDPNMWKEEPSLVCTRCGWEAPPGSQSKFCPECGIKLGTEPNLLKSETFASEDVQQAKFQHTTEKYRHVVEAENARRGDTSTDGMATTPQPVASSGKEASVRTAVHTQVVDTSQRQQLCTPDPGGESVHPFFREADAECGSSDAEDHQRLLRVLAEHLSKLPPEVAGHLMRSHQMPATEAHAHCRVGDHSPMTSAQARTMETRSMSEQKNQMLHHQQSHQQSMPNDSDSRVGHPISREHTTEATHKNTDDVKYSTLSTAISHSEPSRTKQRLTQTQSFEQSTQQIAEQKHSGQSTQSDKEQQMAEQKHSGQSTQSDKEHQMTEQKHPGQSTQSDKEQQMAEQKHSGQSTQSDKEHQMTEQKHPGQSTQSDKEHQMAEQKHPEQSTQYNKEHQMAEQKHPGQPTQSDKEQQMAEQKHSGQSTQSEKEHKMAEQKHPGQSTQSDKEHQMAEQKHPGQSTQSDKEHQMAEQKHPGQSTQSDKEHQMAEQKHPGQSTQSEKEQQMAEQKHPGHSSQSDEEQHMAEQKHHGQSSQYDKEQQMMEQKHPGQSTQSDKEHQMMEQKHPGQSRLSDKEQQMAEQKHHEQSTHSDKKHQMAEQKHPEQSTHSDMEQQMAEQKHPGLSTQQDNQENQTTVAHEKTMEGNKKESTSTKHTLEKVTVKFHAVVSRDFKLDDTDLVVIRFDNKKWPDGGGWECKKHALTRERELNDGYWLLGIRLDIPKNQMIASRGLEYKYVVIKSGRKGKQVAEQIVTKRGLQDNRVLHVSSTVLPKRSGEIWHQYDGMINKIDGESFFAYLGRKIGLSRQLQDKNDADMEIAISAFLPRWEDVCFDIDQTTAGDVTVDEALKQISQIVYCMKGVQTVRVEYLKSYIRQLGQMRHNTNEESPSNAIKRLSTAMVVIYLMVQYNLVRGFSEEDAVVLCESLLLRPPTEDGMYRDVEAVAKNFITCKAGFADSLFTFLSTCIDIYNLAHWLLAIPLHHFLSGCSKPYQPIRDHLGFHHRSDEWWGVQDFSRENKKRNLIHDYKRKSKHTDVDVPFLLGRLQPLFQVDQLLQRTLLAAMDIRHIDAMIASKQIAPEVCMANLVYFLHEGKLTAYGLSQKLAVCKEAILSSITGLQNELPNERELMEKHAHIITVISLDFLHAIVNKPIDINYHETLESVVCIVAASMSTLYNVVHKEDDLRGAESKRMLNVVDGAFNDVIQNIMYWLNQHLPTYMISTRNQFVNSDELQVWSRFLGIRFCNSRYTEHWQQLLLGKLSSRTKRVTKRAMLEVYCDTDFTNCNQLLEKFFSDRAFEALDNDESNAQSLLEQANITQGVKLGLLLSRKFTMTWPAKDRSNNPSIVLEHILNWLPFARYLEIHYKHSTNPVLDDPCRRTISEAVDCLDDAVRHMMTGETSIATLKLLLDHIHQLKEICIVLMKWDRPLVVLATKAEYFPIDVLQTVLEWRQSELNQIAKRKNDIQNMLGMVTKIKSVHTSQLQERLSSTNDSMPLDQLCRPQQYTSETATQKDAVTTELTFLNLDDSVEEMLHEMATSKLNVSQIFDTLWTQHSNTVHYKREREPGCRQLTLEDVATLVWPSAKQAYDELCVCIQDASIMLDEVDKVLGVYADNYSPLEDEFKLMCTSGVDSDWIKGRIRQVEQYHHLDHDCQGAKSIMEAKEAFHLTGDFTVLEAIVEDKSRPLSSITEDVVNAKTLLRDVTEDKMKSIINLTKCKTLIDWLQENINDVKELNVLVELAMNSAAGQGDLEVERVSCLHSAVTGYAPFIYDLRKDTNFEDFMKLCEHVWHALKNDKNLPTKLVDTFRHLDWLKNVKESHGSVELDAISQATAINDRGVYCVGKQNDIEPETVDNVVRLILMPETEDGEQKTYGFQDLQNLQSKLMLVAGKAEKGKDNVDTFTEVLDGVTRLANVYIKICASGSILFRQWVSSFFCEPGRKVNATVDFGLSSHMLQGLSQDCPTVAKQIQAMCEFLEECYTDWLKHIEQQRSRFYFLNHYSTQQLVILCKEIVSLCCSDEKNIGNYSVDPLVYPMLCAVKPNCTTEDLGKAVKVAFQDLAEQEKHANDDGIIEYDTEKTVVKEGTDSEQAAMKDRLTFVVAMSEADFSEELANRALREIPVTEIDAGITWCMEHMDDDFSDDDDDDDGEENGLRRGNTENGTHSLFDVLNVTESFQSITLTQLNNLRTNDGSLKTKLRDLWRSHLQSAATSLTDHLSLEHLGCVLEALADRTEINRPMPQQLITGIPNLIVCAQAEVLQAVLSLYDGGQDLPLPKADEVLLCTEQTTAEEVDLLYRRAARDKQGKIYCLAHADLLDYEVSETAESYLEKHIKGSEDCRLVVICSKEREDRSRLVTALDRHRVTTPVVTTVTRIQTYLKTHFRMECHQQGKLHKAANVDPEHCNVRIVKSDRAGVGKSLRVQRLTEALTVLNGAAAYRKCAACVTVTLQQKRVDHSDVLRTLVNCIATPDRHVPRVFHFDIARETQEGIDDLLFNLLVLGSLTDQTGYVWRKSSMDLYLIETLPLLWHDSASQHDVTGSHREETEYVHRILALLPSLTCRSPQQSLDALTQESPVNGWSDLDQLMDDEEFRSAIFQRPYQCLERFSTSRRLDEVTPQMPQGTQQECLKCLLRYCGIPDPSWAELRHFVWFLNVQLCDSERSNFCSASVQEDLPGFGRFVVHFMIQMSKDFATRSLDVSEETPGLATHSAQHELPGGSEEETDNDNEQHGKAARVPFQLRRRWETSPHPYLFFNSDRHSMTFLGFYIDYKTGNMLDPETNTILEKQVMPRRLYEGLTSNFVKLKESFDHLAREMKICKLCSVMGVEDIHDPDEEYVLTTDNVKKILAIHMRLRCDIPVVIMGETGCGKTRLIKFMCDLWKPPGTEDIQNMVLVKVHGGTTEQDIIKKVRQASELAQENKEKFAHVDTVLFFDEANTTEAIGLIKEIICDKRMKGKPLAFTEGLKVIAACNPYRKHSDEMIQRLEQAGLGYRVQARDTKDKLGYIPMRQLVYRVQALPQSILPLVWDFGQLSFEVESLYIKQMVHRCINDESLPDVPGLHKVASDILATSQKFMRSQPEECSFVSLRDVKRVLDVMSWFYEHRRLLFCLMDEHAKEEIENNYACDDKGKPEYERLDDVTRSLVLALGVCYHACLQNRAEYRKCVARHFILTGPFRLPNGARTIDEEINRCEDVFLNNVQLEPNIARNQALKENIFMMIICIELRIPLFLVGKPGSSKSLARTIVADAMQGKRARSELFQQFKEAYMISFQCSPLSTPEGIVATFRQGSQLQKDKDLSEFVAAVVLDEVGLAEDSPSMPLKALHPLLEDGCVGDEDAEPYKKVAFIGISNWALDPAKMNRGILVQRGIPDESELEFTAREITTDRLVQKKISPYVLPLAEAYLVLYNSAPENREFFGLRDFYSLIKMVSAFSKKSHEEPTWLELEHSIKRNFGGLDHVDPVEIFASKMQNVDKRKGRKATDPSNDAAALIRRSLFRDSHHDRHNETRYLLILTENYAALSILPRLLEMRDTITIFGSSFPKDQEYTQVCRNINRIKVCMETGKTIVLLNLENLYESLYDALNQYYVYLGGQRFVDLGLGTHRVKCRVHQDFRLIVVAEKQVVYSKFPIPLINRLEKHFLAMTTMLSSQQIQLLNRLKQWAKQFADVDTHLKTTRGWKGLSEGDVFIGYHADTAASLVLQVSRDTETRQAKVDGDEENDKDEEHDEEWANKILDGAQKLLLQCATPESVIRLRKTKLRHEELRLTDCYFKEQKHESLEEFLSHELCGEMSSSTSERFIQITTHSKLLSDADIRHLRQALKMPKKAISHVRLQAFATEQQFSKCIRGFLNAESPQERLMLLQCDSGDQNDELIACARHNIENEYNQTPAPGQKRHVMFVIQLPRTAGGCFTGFQGGKWLSFHIDDLQPQRDNMPSLLTLMDKSVCSLFGDAVGEEVMEESGIVECFAKLDIGTPDTDNQPDVDAAVSRQPRECKNPAEETPICYTDTSDTEIIGLQKEPVSSHVDSLIRQCVHAAGAILKDPEDMKERKTERVQLLLQLLKPKKPGEHELCFIGVLRKRMYLLLRDKEEKAMMGDMARRWLSNEAASVASVNKAGTFRQAIRQNLEEKVTPMLAAVITLADVNSGLDILSDSNASSSWLRTMYLRMLNDPRVVALTYVYLQSTEKRKVELDEMQVWSTGCDGAVFKARMPFSWIIKNTVDELIQQAQRMPERDDLDTLVSRLLQECPLGVILGQLSDGHKEMTDLVDLYLTDFVRMVHRPRSCNDEMELQFVRQAILSAARCMYPGNRVDAETESDSSGSPLKLTIERIHLVFNSIQQRLQLFSEAVRLWSVCVLELDELSRTPDSCFPEDEMTLDVQAVHLLLKSMTPTGKCLNDVNQRVAWIKTVQRIQPLVEQFLSVVDSKAVEYGRVSGELANTCRRVWTRISVVQLFVSHVCPVTTDNESLGVKRCMPLWMMLDKHQDFKKLEALQKVETFLKSTNKTAHKTFFGELKDCQQCESPIETSIRLPCDHVICHNCVKQTDITELRKCPECKETWNEKDTLIPVEEHLDVAERYNTYKEHCNTFFMELVSRLCFEGDTPPEGDVVKRLLEHVTRKTDTDRPLTKQMTVFDSIDPSPVVRSLLLQLLLRSEVHDVKRHLQQYFDQAKQMLQQDTQQTVELCMLFVNCLEDSYHNKASRFVESETELLKMAIHAMTKAKKPLTAKGLHVDKLEAIALTRFGLSVTATWMERLYVRKQRCNMADVRKMFEMAGKLCDQPHLRWPGLFLMRQLSRRFGLDCLRAVVEVPQLKWVIPRSERDMQNDEMVDRFVVIGENYKHLRKIITWVVLGENPQVIDDVLKKLPRDNKTERSLLLALYTEVTVPNALEDTEHATLTETLTKLGTFCTQSAYIQSMGLADQMLTNRLGVSNVHLNVSTNQDPRHLMISSMITHFKVAMRCSHDNQLLQPLLLLIDHPDQMQKSFLPAMPDDPIEKMRQILLETRDPGWNKNPILWECPNGHPYFIDDCGQPQTVGRCNECGAAIGGRGYKPESGNKPVTKEDRGTGHHLGPAQKRSRQPAPERQLSPAQAAILRLLTHMAMYLGANNNPQQVACLIKSDLDVENVSQYLWKHIVCDTEVLVNAVGKSIDDCALLISLVMCQFTDDSRVAGVRGRAKFLSEEARQEWEVAFTDTYISPKLTGLDSRLQEANTTLVNDERLGNNSLLKELYETETTPVDTEELEHIERTAAMWCHRTRITIEHLIHELNENSLDTKQFRILHMFLQEEHQLRALMFLPSIVKLQRILMERYRRKIDKGTANNLKVADFIQSLPEDTRDDHKGLIDHFAQAWNLLRERIAGAAFGDTRVPEELCEEAVGEEMSLAMLLPSVKGIGVCSFALLRYLAMIQNNFVEKYSKLTKQSCDDSVPVTEATSAHLISYHPEKDLLPLVISCCQYSLVVGKGSEITYDFVVLQRQLEERFIRNRPRLDPKVDLMVYREDFTSANIFANLDKHIPQEPLGRTEQSRIQNELRHLPEVTLSLANLDIAIGFLVSVGGLQDSLLADFMTKTLGMRASIDSQQARQHCCLKHVKSLWLLMSHERAKLLARYGQDPFDDIEEKYQETLTEKQIQQLNAMLQHVNVDSLLSAIYECNLLQITVKQDPSAEDYVDNQDQQLGYVVSEYLEATDAPPLPVLTNKRFPTDILAKHCLDTWRQIVLYAARLQHAGK